MKITRLKLVNFIGIKHGMDLDEVEINFRDRKIVMLNGGNGSGKSTIMSQLHPFKDSFDDRKKVILDDKDGLKEIDIEHNGSKYEISHTYGKKAQSFVKKDGTEMNENGGVKTFDEFIKNEFGLTSDYFKIGKIGSNTENFIQLTATERKNYISKFLPAIEDYLEKFNIVKEKFRVAQSDIKTVSADLEKLEEESSLRVRIESLETLISTLDNEINSKSGQIAVLNSEIENLRNETSKVDIAELNLDLIQKETRKKDIEQFALVFVSKYSKFNTDDLEKFVDDKSKEISKLSEEIAVLSADLRSKNAELVRSQNDLSKLNYRLSELKVTESLETINTKISEANESLAQIKASNDDPFFAVVRDNQRDIAVQLSKFEMLKNFVIKYFSNMKSSTIIPNMSNIEMFMKDDFTATMQSQVDIIRKTIEQKQNALSVHIGMVAQKKADFEKFDAIYGENNITSVEEIEACRACPLARDAMEYKDLPEVIENLEREVAQMKRDLEEYEMKADNISETRNLYKQFVSIYEQMNPRTNSVFIKFANDNGSLVSMIRNGNLNDFTNATDELVNKVNSAVFSIQEISKIESELQNLAYKKNISENNESIKKEIESGISEKNEEISRVSKEISDMKELSSEKTTELELMNKVFSDHKEHLEGRKERASLSTMISTLSSAVADYNAKKQLIASKEVELNEASAMFEDLRKRRSESNDELIKSKTTLVTIDSLKAKKDALDADYNNLRLMKDALDPNKGVPLYFIKAYLEKTKDIANELLGLAFGEDFEINFVTSEREFFIQVRAGENVKNDIKEASQGEVAITTISISLALIEQAIGEYNILALDEIDGPLDTSNRENFISILNTQIDKLGIEQVFVISHNDAFDTEEMDLILLRDSNVAQKGEEFMRNKEVIFELK